MQVTVMLLACVGVSECAMKPFVVDGDRADIHDFPYIAYLGIKCNQIDDEQMYFCGSSIINQHVTLTAAHCLFFCTDRSSITVCTGHVNFHKGIFSSAYSFLIHEQYRQQSVANDIALVTLTTPMKFNDIISRVAVMPKPPHKEEARIAGWGCVNELKEKSTSNLIFTKQYVIERKQCEHILKKIPNGTFCGRSMTLRGYASVGDSGSPLVVRKFIQIGIVSFKKPNVSKSVIIYTDTGYFYNWIKFNVKRIMCDIN